MKPKLTSSCAYLTSVKIKNAYGRIEPFCNSGTRLVAHDPGGVDEAPVGRPRDPIVGPPLLPVARDHAHQAQQEEHPRDHVHHPCFFCLAVFSFPFSLVLQILSAIQCHERQLVFLSAKIHQELKRLYMNICQDRRVFNSFRHFHLVDGQPDSIDGFFAYEPPSIDFLGLLNRTKAAPAWSRLPYYQLSDLFFNYFNHITASMSTHLPAFKGTLSCKYSLQAPETL